MGLRRRGKVGILPATSLASAEWLHEELTFTRWYHSAAGNRVLHMLCLPVFFWGLFLVLDVAVPAWLCLEGSTRMSFGYPCTCSAHRLSLGPVAAALLYWVSFSVIDPVVGLVWGLCCGLLLVGVSVVTDIVRPWWVLLLVGAGTATVAGLLQILGHVLFEGRLPAFRLPELLFATPFLLTLDLLANTCKWQANALRLIHNDAPQWAGTERAVMKPLCAKNEDPATQFYQTPPEE